MIRFENVNKWYGSYHALKSITEEVSKGDVVVVCGPSGSGKSTLLRTINRLEPIQGGRILIEGHNICDKGINVNRLRSRIGFVFQQFNLFPHLSVLQNIILAPMHVRDMTRGAASKLAMQLLAKVGVEHKAEAVPPQLSGGQQQRVAIARALATNPPIMLFDEPTASLDPELVGEVLQVMKQLAREGMTMISVTHEMGFARDVAHRVWFMDEGAILERSTPDVFFRKPEHPRAQKFVSDIRNV